MARHSAALPHRERTAPPVDFDDTDDHGGPDDPDVIGGLFFMEYVDAKGSRSARDIIVRRVMWRAQKLSIGAHCLLRDQYRCFIVDNIVTLANGRTGEVIASPPRFLSGLASEYEEPARGMRREKGGGFAEPAGFGVGPTRKQLRDLVRPAAILLMAMAKADERLTKEEIGVIMDLVFHGARATFTFQQTEMLTEMVEELCALQPSQNMITRALNLTLDRGPFPHDLPSWLSRMARADGAVVPEEHDAYRGILSTLRRLAAGRA